MSSRRQSSPLLAGGLLALVASTAAAATLRVGLASEPTALDPHYHAMTTNVQVTAHLFDPLLATGADLALKPGLAQSYRLVDDLTWEFKLRRNVRFHNGAGFDANSVIFTLCRIREVPNSPGPYTLFTGSIVAATAPDPHTVILRTARPNPLLPYELSYVGIISDSLIAGEKVTFGSGGRCRIAGTWPSTTDFNTGRSAVGTGPYRFVDYVKGDYILFKRNDDYWGKRPDWDTLRLRNIPAAPARTAALLAGDVDFIESPPVEHAHRLARDGGQYRVASTTAIRVMFLGLDLRDRIPPGVTGTSGRNPFLDERVRRALSLAVDRRTIVDKVMRGYATPAEQLLAKKFFGADPAAPPLPYDPELARQLLAQAGYPRGFTLTLTGTNDRYVNDQHILLAVAQMWSKIGVTTRLDAMTKSVFFPKARQGHFGAWLIGWGSLGDMSAPLQAVLATRIKERGHGTANQSGYSDPVLDRMLDDARMAMDPRQRAPLLGAASRHVMERLPVIPLHFEQSSWAMRKELSYEARADQGTHAFDVSVAK